MACSGDMSMSWLRPVGLVAQPPRVSVRMSRLKKYFIITNITERA
jgi:hypothetical protein